jgi:DNA recombination protein RmuC
MSAQSDFGMSVALFVLLGAVVGAVIGYLVAALRANRRATALTEELAGTRARLTAQAELHQRTSDQLARNEEQLRASFDQIAGETLRSNSEMFLTLARESLAREHVTADATLKERETAIAQLVEPIRQALEKSEQQVQQLERERRESFITLKAHIETLGSGQAQLARETRNLVTALRRPEVRGRWGEITLKRVVELAGLVEHCDFTEQLQIEGDERTLRPDLVVHMPDARDLVVDAKTPLDAYLEAVEAQDDDMRRASLVRHARQVEARIRELASKSYWEQFENSPDFAVLFLPGDQFLSAALAEKPELIDMALKQSIIVATPSTLMALLKVIAYGWRQASVAQNAAVIRELGEELHRRLNTFTQHVAKVGKSLTAAVDAYNAAVGSLDRNVLPQARRFPELGVTGDAPLPAMEAIERVARMPAGSGGESANDSSIDKP